MQETGMEQAANLSTSRSEDGGGIVLRNVRTTCVIPPKLELFITPAVRTENATKNHAACTASPRQIR
jgi:hypothetical protein